MGNRAVVVMEGGGTLGPGIAPWSYTRALLIRPKFSVRVEKGLRVKMALTSDTDEKLSPKVFGLTKDTHVL